MDNVIENNRIINKFLGWEVVLREIDSKYSNQQWLTTMDKDGNWDSSRCVYTGKEGWEEEIVQVSEEMLIQLATYRCGKYNEDWNRLMSVVNKIENLEVVEQFTISTSRILIKTYEDYKLEFWTNGFSKIEAVYNSIVDFIKWYNNQNK